MSFSWDKAEEKMPFMVLSDPLKEIEGFAMKIGQFYITCQQLTENICQKR